MRSPNKVVNLHVLVVLAAFAAWAPMVSAQGPTSRATLPGATVTRLRDGTITQEEVPVPDMFRTEGPFVERNVRFDYQFSNNLREPPADESLLFTEVSYNFTEQFGIVIAAPYVLRDDFTGTDVSGFGDLAVGARYVCVGSEQTDLFKLALALNVLSPTGNEQLELGEGQAVLEPELLTQFILTDRAFANLQLGLGIPTENARTTEFEYNMGFGYVFQEFDGPSYFSYPTLIAEVNGLTGVGGVDAGTTLVDLTAGLRWSIGDKTIAGLAASFPVTGPRDFETQFIFSLIYRYGVEPGVQVPRGIGAQSSRAYF